MTQHIHRIYSFSSRRPLRPSVWAGLLVIACILLLPRISQSEIRNVLQAGALGNGLADDTAALHAVVSEADSGDVLFFPEGVYLISETIAIDTHGLTLSGEGRYSIIRATAPSFHLLTVHGRLTTIRALAFEGAATDDSTAQFGIFTEESRPAVSGWVENCFFTGPDEQTALNSGIKLDTGAHSWHIKDNIFARLIGRQQGTGYGVLIGDSSGNFVTGNRFTGGLMRGRHAIYLAGGASKNMISGNVIHDYNSCSIQLFSLAHQPAVAFNTITDNQIFNQQVTHPTFEGAIVLSGKTQNNLVSNNLIAGVGVTGKNGSEGASSGIMIEGLFKAHPAIGNFIQGNKIHNTTAAGIMIKGAVATDIIGNTIMQASHGYPGSFAAIDIRLGLYEDKKIQAVNNVIRDNIIRGSVHRSGVRLDPSDPAPRKTLLLHNMITPGERGAIETNDVTDVTITRNLDLSPVVP